MESLLVEDIFAIRLPLEASRDRLMPVRAVSPLMKIVAMIMFFAAT